jgi:hypothetical protein
MYGSLTLEWVVGLVWTLQKEEEAETEGGIGSRPIGTFLLKLPTTLEVCSFTIITLPTRPKHGNISKDLSDEHMKCLPKRLKQLDLPESPNITATCTIFLPRYLNTLRMGNRGSKAIPNWFITWCQSQVKTKV